MSVRVPLVTKIRVLEGQIELLQNQAAACDPETMKEAIMGFRYQEETFMAILADYRKIARDEQKK